MWGVLVAAGMSLFRWVWPRIAAALGVVTLSATVYDPLLGFLRAKIDSSLAGVGSEAYSFLVFCGVPEAVQILFAAVTLNIGIRASKALFAKKAAENV